MNIKVGFIGFGNFAKLRYSILLKNTNVDLIGYYDPLANDSAQLKKFSELDALLSLVDAVIISVPPKFAPEYVRLSLISGLDVFCEKPAARNADELLLISNIVNKSNSVLAYGFNHRQHQSVQKIKNTIDSEILGKILWMRGRYGKEVDTNYRSSWRCDKDLNGGGILIDQGIHMVDLINYLSGGLTDGQAVLSDRFLNINGVEDNAFINLYSQDSGISASIHSTITQWRYLFSLEIFLENGDIILNGLRTNSGNYGDEILAISNRSNNQKNEYAFSTNESWEIEMTEFVRAINEVDEYKFSNYSDAIEITKLIDKIYLNSIWT